MARYLNHLDSLKEKYIATQNTANSADYPFTQFHYYQSIAYVVDNSISFCQTLHAVKLVNTAILYVDPETQPLNCLNRCEAMTSQRFFEDHNRSARPSFLS